MDKHEETSIWKKEITFRRKPKPAKPATPVVAEKPAETSIWKKEISFRRKPKPPAELVPAPLPQPAHAETAEPMLPPVVPPPVAPPLAQPVQTLVSPLGDVPAPTAVVPPVPESFSMAVPPVAPPVEPSVQPPADWAPPVTPAAASVVPELAAVAAAAEDQAAIQAPPQAPPPAQPVPDPEPAAEQAPELSRRERREARRVARTQRKSNPSMHDRVVGLKIGASQLAAAEVINKAGPRVVRMARMPLEPGIVVGGELREPDQLAAALKTFFRKNKLPRSCVRLGVSNNRIGVRTFEIAGIEDEKQLANAIRFRAQEALPIPLDEAVLDSRILEDRIDEEGVRVRRVLLVVAHRELVERYVAACRKAGLKLIGIDLEAFALLRALADPATPPAADAAVVCITVGHDRSTLAVSDGEVCEFTRVLSWGGSALDVALARVLDVTPSSAEAVRRQLILGEEGEAAGLDAPQADEARRTIAAELQVFAREIVASLRFYQEQPGSLGISELLVTGGAAASGGLTAELERLIGIPVRVVDPLARVRVSRKLRNAPSGGTGSLAVALGLGIED
jgi:type IV pilus assembly protein PilM